jgi:hypothetical protein
MHAQKGLQYQVYVMLMGVAKKRKGNGFYFFIDEKEKS